MAVPGTYAAGQFPPPCEGQYAPNPYAPSTIGVLQLVVTIFTFGFGGLWGFIDGILILTGNVPDAQGRTLRE